MSYPGQYPPTYPYPPIYGQMPKTQQTVQTIQTVQIQPQMPSEKHSHLSVLINYQIEDPNKEYNAIENGFNVIASSIYDPNHDVQRIRLNDHGREGAHAWCAGFNDTNQWIQISSEVPKSWIGISIQGRGDSDQWVTKFKVLSSMDGHLWMDPCNGQEFIGSHDRNSIMRHNFKEPFISRCIRICPKAWNGHISMRCEAHYKDTLLNAYCSLSHV